jgi:hypothetical protein
MYSPERNFFGAGTESSSEKKVQTSILNISQAPFSPQTHNNNVPQNQYPDRQVNPFNDINLFSIWMVNLDK